MKALLTLPVMLLAMNPAMAGYADFIADDSGPAGGGEMLLFAIIPLLFIIISITGAAFEKGRLWGIASIPVCAALVWLAWTFWIPAVVIGFVLAMGFGILCVVGNFRNDRDRY